MDTDVAVAPPVGRRSHPFNLAIDVPTGEVFRNPAAGVPSDLRHAMTVLCRFVWEEHPHRYSLFGHLPPGLLIHWRVQVHLVFRWSPSLRHAYQKLWAQEELDGHPLSQYGMSRLSPCPVFPGGLGRF